MKLWRTRSSTESPREVQKEDLLSRIRKDIQHVRRQGDPPDRDPASFSRFSCDLCNGTFPKRELRQCSLCGRWACASCWTEKYYTCKACSGVITLRLATEGLGEEETRVHP